jgi:hypothetical protein
MLSADALGTLHQLARELPGVSAFTALRRSEMNSTSLTSGSRVPRGSRAIRAGRLGRCAACSDVRRGA